MLCDGFRQLRSEGTVGDASDSYIELWVSGRTVRLSEIELLPEERVLEWRRLTALAQQQLGTVTTGVGFIGSLGWVAAGTLVVGALEGLLTSAAQKEGLRSLSQAQSIFEELRWSGQSLRIDQIDRLDLPYPTAWRGSTEVGVVIDLRTLSRAEAAALAADRRLSGQDAVDFKITSYVARNFIAASDEFIAGHCADCGRIKIRWSAVDSYRVVVAGADLAVTPPPPTPSKADHYLG